MEVNKKLLSSISKASITGMLAFSSFLPAHSQGAYALKQVNSPYDEQHPVLSPKDELFLTIGFHPENKAGEKDKGDIWFSVKNDFNQWKAPQHIAELSTKGYDVLLGFVSENSVYVYHNGKGKAHGIHQYRREGNNWLHEGPLDFGSFRNNGEFFGGSLHTSGQILLFAMDSYGSYGNDDIYVSFKKNDGKWTIPQNLGPVVNSGHQEMTPFLSKDKKVLYFSSNGHGSLGGRDIFYSHRLDDSWENWSTPKRLSEAINSEGVELSYFIDPGNAYTSFFTTTQNSEGYGDIMMKRAEEVALTEEKPVIRKKVEKKTAFSYSTEDVQRNDGKSGNTGTGVKLVSADDNLPETSNNVADQVRVRVLDAQTHDPVKYRVVYKDNEGKEVANIEISNDREVLSSVAHGVHLSFLAAGYLPFSTTWEKLKDRKSPILVKSVQKGASLILEDILFKKGTAELADMQSGVAIQQLVQFLQENPSLNIRIEGHTDNLGNSKLNKELSMDRAGTIRDQLVNQGVEFERIRVNGWGGSQPIADNKTEEGRKLNRRVELVIID